MRCEQHQGAVMRRRGSVRNDEEEGVKGHQRHVQPEKELQKITKFFSQCRGTMNAGPVLVLKPSLMVLLQKVIAGS